MRYYWSNRNVRRCSSPSGMHEGAQNILVTNDYEDVIKTGTATIQCIPAVKFLLFGTM